MSSIELLNKCLLSKAISCETIRGTYYLGLEQIKEKSVASKWQEIISAWMARRAFT